MMLQPRRIARLVRRWRGWARSVLSAAGLRRRRFAPMARATLRAAVAIAVLLAAGFMPVAQAADGEAPRPNIVFILADDLGYGDVGFMGQRWIRTPHIDRLAREGMVFTRHYAGAPMCTPSRCSLMTGMHNGHNTLTDNVASHVTLRPRDRTVAEVLRDAGYATHFIGKWGLGGAEASEDFGGTDALIPEAMHGLPTRKGFETSYAFLDQRTAHGYFPQTMWRGETREMIAGNHGLPLTERTVYIHDRFTEEALEILREADGSRPVYLQLSYTIPHRETKFPRSPLPADEPDPRAYRPYQAEDFAGMDPAPMPVDAAYASMITLMDDDIGRIIEAVDGNAALAPNTLIIFTSDNGPQFTDGHTAEMFDSSGGLRGRKFFLYEGGIRVPFAARWRGSIAPGGRSDHAGHFADFLPTAADLAGAAAPGSIDGVSYAPTLSGEEEQAEHDCLVWTQPGATDRPTHAIRAAKGVDGRAWKLLRLPDGRVELYDLAADPTESVDRAAEYPEVLARLDAILDAEDTGPR